MNAKIDRDVPGQMWLVKKPNDTMQLHTQYGAWEGSKRLILDKMCHEFGVRSKEINLALQEMEWNDHLAANFGIFGGFIFTQEDFPVKSNI